MGARQFFGTSLLAATLVCSVGTTEGDLDRRIAEFDLEIKALRRSIGLPWEFCARLKELEQTANDLAREALQEGAPRMWRRFRDSAMTMAAMQEETKADPRYFYSERSYGIQKELKKIQSKNREAMDRLDDDWLN